MKMLTLHFSEIITKITFQKSIIHALHSVYNFLIFITDRPSVSEIFNYKMPREVKEYDIRRSEFMEATRTFFFSIGYDRMTVQKLTQKVGVAKGTFYHYFQSKEDLLTQWVLYEMSEPIKEQKMIAENDSFSAIKKMHLIFEKSNNWKVQHLHMIIPLMRVLHDDHNLRLRVEMARQSSELLGPIFQKIILQGINEGTFNTPYPIEIAYKLPKIAQLFSEDIALILLDSSKHSSASLPQIKRKLLVWQDSIERMLGAPTSSFDFITDPFIESFVKYITASETIENTVL